MYVNLYVKHWYWLKLVHVIMVMPRDIKYAIEFPGKHIQIGRRRLENIPGAVHSVLQYARSCAISTLTFHSVHVAPKKDRSFRFPCRKTNSGSRQGAQPTLSPTAWRINARSLYEVDGVRVERIARKRRRQGAGGRGSRKEKPAPSQFVRSHLHPRGQQSILTPPTRSNPRSEARGKGEEGG